MDLLIALSSLLPILLLGDLVVSAFRARGKWSSNPLERLPLAWAFGTGIVTLLLFYLSLIAYQRAFSITIAFVLILSIFHLFYLSRNMKSDYGSAVRNILGRESVVLVLFFVALAILVGLVAFSAVPGNDSFGFWGFKAKVIFSEGGWPILSPSYHQLDHPDYPLLVPSEQGWVYTFLGTLNDKVVRIVFVASYVFLALLFFTAIRPSFNLLLTYIYTALLVTTPILALSALSGYADLPLILFIFGAVIFIFRWLERGDTNALVVGAILASLAILVKREGMVYWLLTLFFLSAYAIAGQRQASTRARSKQVLLFIIIGISIAASWFLFLNISGLSNSDFSTLTFRELWDRFDRVPVIIAALVQELFLTPGKWGILWFLFFIVVFWQRQKLRRASRLYLVFMVIMPILVFCTAYLFSTWQPFTAHMATSLDRLMMQTTPIAWYFIASQTIEMNTWYQELVGHGSSVSGPLANERPNPVRRRPK